MTPSMLKFVLVVLCVCGVQASDVYITESQEQCKAKSDLFSCGKYEAAKFITKATNGEPTTKTKIIDGVVDFVTLEQPEPTETLFPAARQMPNDSEFRKFAKFVQRQVDAYLGSRAISISLPAQTRIVDAEEPNNEIGKFQYNCIINNTSEIEKQITRIATTMNTSRKMRTFKSSAVMFMFTAIVQDCITCGSYILIAIHRYFCLLAHGLVNKPQIYKTTKNVSK